jgi:hypothetical protein
MTEKVHSYSDSTDSTTALRAGVASSCSKPPVSHSLDNFRTRITEDIDSLHEQLKPEPKGYRKALILDLLDDPSNPEHVLSAAAYLDRLSRHPMGLDAALHNCEHLSQMSKIAIAVLPGYSFATPDDIDASAKRLASARGDTGQIMDDLWDQKPLVRDTKEGTFDGQTTHAVDLGEAHDIAATDFADCVLSRLSFHAKEALAELPDPKRGEERQQMHHDTLQALSMPKSRTCKFVRDSFKALYPVLDPRFLQKRPLYAEMDLLAKTLKQVESQVPRFSLKTTGSENFRDVYTSSLNTYAHGTETHRDPKSVLAASRAILGFPSNPGPSEDKPADSRRRLLVNAISLAGPCGKGPNALQKWEAKVQTLLDS